MSRSFFLSCRIDEKENAAIGIINFPLEYIPITDHHAIFTIGEFSAFEAHIRKKGVFIDGIGGIKMRKHAQCVCNFTNAGDEILRPGIAAANGVNDRDIIYGIGCGAAFKHHADIIGKIKINDGRILCIVEIII